MRAETTLLALLPDFDLTLVVLPEVDLGSSREANLHAVQRRLERVCRHAGTAFVALDLKHIRQAGARLLSVVTLLGRQLAALGKRLLVCGDASRLLETAGLDQLYLTFDSLDQALAWCGTERQYVASRPHDQPRAVAV